YYTVGTVLRYKFPRDASVPSFESRSIYMKNLRMATALVVVALLLALVPASLAQDQTFGLSVEDKAVLDAANAATASATSAQFNFVANLTATSEGETLTLDLSGTGLFDQNENGEANFQLSLNGSADMGENGQMP